MPALPLAHFTPQALRVVGRTVANTSDPLEELQPVICSWPLSGQYGVGTRILYYVLVAACLLARKTEWLRNACLAAALTLPAIAAIHGIVLAALHVDGAVDMDVFGAFQLCAIGILAAPASVRLSKTYFNLAGRNVMFVWTMLVVAGLLALTVEFFRADSSPCSDDGSGQPLYRGSKFPYGDTTCGLICSVEEGPHSPMRKGSANDIYVIPTPHVFRFGAATLVAAGCCVPGILSSVSTWDKIVRTNWAKKFGAPDADQVIEGTNGATIGGMKDVNNVIRRLLSVVEIPMLGGAVLALIIIGERNFWSGPVQYQTEPPANIGQWNSILASVFAAGGSLYMLLSAYLRKAEEGTPAVHSAGPCHCSCHEHSGSRSDFSSDHPITIEMPREPPSARTTDTDVTVGRHDTSPSHPPPAGRTDTYPDSDEAARGLGIHTINSNSSAPSGSRHEVTKALMKFANALGTASPDRFDDSAFRHGKATGFPEVPGEGNRNSKLQQIKQQWSGELNPDDDDDDDGLTPRGRRSRANSLNSSSIVISRTHSIGPRAYSPQPPQPPPPPKAQPQPQACPGGPSLLGPPTAQSPENASEPVFPARRPSPDELEQTRSQSGTVVTLHQGPNSPAIVLSSDDEPRDASFPRVVVSAAVERPTP
ncbi:hypothetical protein N658DRAFT_518282 [Parathielavia hyrcaniae]|uniref:Uncharacterized protein n=1 Tax=Parathielavia hyrcaniae TaxID=113614 RepID=A0AAN6SYZ4_9PEZI|nr:hypothetical protein N658DRAFT_518282 [Parathielavia hyrcaniae]